MHIGDLGSPASGALSPHMSIDVPDVNTLNVFFLLQRKCNKLHNTPIIPIISM